MFKTVISSAAFILALLCSSAMAQETLGPPDAIHGDWVVFEESSPKMCWVVTGPKIPAKTTKDGKVVSVRPRKIGLFVHYRPSENINGEVSYTGGYPFDKNVKIILNIEGSKFEMLDKDEWAWPNPPLLDKKIVAEMKRGFTAEITAQSQRGTLVVDTFSLQGFTAAVQDAEKRCAG